MYRSDMLPIWSTCSGSPIVPKEARHPVSLEGITIPQYPDRQLHFCAPDLPIYTSHLVALNTLWRSTRHMHGPKHGTGKDKFRKMGEITGDWRWQCLQTAYDSREEASRTVNGYCARPRTQAYKVRHSAPTSRKKRQATVVWQRTFRSLQDVSKFSSHVQHRAQHFTSWAFAKRIMSLCMVHLATVSHNRIKLLAPELFFLNFSTSCI